MLCLAVAPSCRAAVSRRLALLFALVVPLVLRAAPVWADTALGLDACLRLVVAKNPDAAAAAIDARLGELATHAAEHRYGLTLSGGPELHRSVRPTAETVVSGGVTQLQELDQSYQASLRKALATGGSLTLSLDQEVADTNSRGVTINPAFTPTARLGFEQPLLRGLLAGYQERDAALLAQRRDRARARERLEQLVGQAEDAYWQLHAARRGVAVREQALGLVKKLVHIDEEKAKAGLVAKLDVLQARASLAVRESELLGARRDVARARDHLRALIDPALAETAWDEELVPADEPVYKPRTVVFAAAWAVALDHRADLVAAAADRARARIAAEQAERRAWPKLDLQTGAGVTNLAADPTRALAGLQTLQNYDLRAGLALEVPLGPQAERDEALRARLQEQQAELAERATRQRAYADVRDAVRDVQVEQQRVAATRLARELAGQKLDAEQAKLAAGLSTNFEVLQFQGDFQQASLAEVEATIAFVQASSRLERAQGTLLVARGLLPAS